MTLNGSGVLVILKCLILVAEIRFERQLGTVTCLYLCLSALAESSSETSIMCFVLLLDDIRVDECSYEDPGPLPGPR